MQKYWSVLFAVVNLAAVVILPVAVLWGWWLPRNVSSNFGGVDDLFYLILAITALVFVLTQSVLVYNMYVFRHAPGRRAEYSHGNFRLELLWTIIPAILLALLGFLQIHVWEVMKYPAEMPKADGNTLQMVVVARQWEWRVRYPSPDAFERWREEPGLAEQWRRAAAYPYEDLGQFDDVHVVNEIHTWKDGQSLVHLKTRDVLHSFFLPNLRQKQDALPGKVIPVWFLANESNTERNGYHWTEEPGREWPLACAEFCGDRHSMMRGKLFVHKDREDFLDWLRETARRQQQRTASAGQ